MATRTFGVMDTDEQRAADGAGDSNFLMAISEKEVVGEDGMKRARFGVCLLDCAVGEFLVSRAS